MNAALVARKLLFEPLQFNLPMCKETKTIYHVSNVVVVKAEVEKMHKLNGVIHQRGVGVIWLKLSQFAASE